MSTPRRLAPRTALFLPASNPRAIEKARTLHADMVVLDLEDAVRAGDKQVARELAVVAAQEGFGHRLCAIRVNAGDSAEQPADITAVAGSACDYVVLPKAEEAADVARIARAVAKPLLLMIETPRGVLAAAELGAVDGVDGLIIGTNDLRCSLGMPLDTPREALGVALQTVVLAARANGCWAIDGVFNALDDAAGLEEECRHGRALGFDGKSLIHPDQIAVATQAFGPTERELAEARALIEAATGGAERFRDRMIEAMHVEQARALLERAV